MADIDGTAGALGPEEPDAEDAAASARRADLAAKADRARNSAWSVQAEGGREGRADGAPSSADSALDDEKAKTQAARAAEDELFERLLNVRERVKARMDDFAQNVREGGFEKGSLDLSGYLYSAFSRSVEDTRGVEGLSGQPWTFLRNVAMDLAREGHGDAAILVASGALEIRGSFSDETERAALSDTLKRLIRLGRLSEIQSLMEADDLKGARARAKEMLKEEADPETAAEIQALVEDLRLAGKQKKYLRYGALGLIASLIVGMGALQYSSYRAPSKPGEPVAIMSLAPPLGGGTGLIAGNALWCEEKSRTYSEMVERGKEDPNLMPRLRAEVQDYMSRCKTATFVPGAVEAAKLQTGGRNWAAESSALARKWRKDAAEAVDRQTPPTPGR